MKNEIVLLILSFRLDFSVLLFNLRINSLFYKLQATISFISQNTFHRPLPCFPDGTVILQFRSVPERRGKDGVQGHHGFGGRSPGKTQHEAHRSSPGFPFKQALSTRNPCFF
jgi:hypothetical protein